MRKLRKISLQDLIAENKQAILSNKNELEKIETKIENKRVGQSR